MTWLSNDLDASSIEVQESFQDEYHSERSLDIHEALIVEYREMARWYDRFWGDYLDKTLELPMRLCREAKRKLQNSRGPLTIVDVACGTGEFLKRFSSSFHNNELVSEQACNFCGVEPSREMLEQARQKFLKSNEANIRLLQGQAEALPLDACSVDIICSTNAIHFFGDKERALGEMYRALKPHSSLIITDWCADYWLVRMYHFLEYLRWNVYHKFDKQYPGPLHSHRLLELVNKAGFYNVQLSTYRVRVFGFFFWGMQTVTASKP
jgi:ubiquinone/menaquinone biosynthesis C-methylase UbiE